MALGLSLGGNKKKVDTKTAVDKTETTSQTGKSTTATTGTTTGTQTGTTTGTSTQTGTSSQVGTSTQTGSQVGSTQQTAALFRDPILVDLEGAVTDALGNIGSHATVGQFDPEAFIEGGLARASSLQSATLEDQINQLVSGVGGTPESNSAVALLANRARGDAAANLAGIESQLTGQAEEIVRANALAGNTIDATQNEFIAGLLGALKGGTSTQTGQEQQQTSQAGATTQTGATSASEQQDQQQEQQTVQTQELLQILDQLLNGTTRTVGTESTKGTETKIGGGISFSG